MIKGEPMPWFFDLEENGGTLNGELRVEGWEPSAVMNSWYEDSKGREFEAALEGAGKAVLTAGGIFIHESGHHNETTVIVKGSLLQA